MKTLYNTVLARFKAQIPEIKEVDFEIGQLEVLADGVKPSVLFPCALIDIDYPQCNNVDELETVQTVKPKVAIKLAFEVQLPTNSISTDAKRNSGLAFLDIVQKVYENFQGYSTDDFESFARISQSPDKRFDGTGIKVYDIVFETLFLDESAE